MTVDWHKSGADQFPPEWQILPLKGVYPTLSASNTDVKGGAAPSAAVSQASELMYLAIYIFRCAGKWGSKGSCLFFWRMTVDGTSLERSWRPFRIPLQHVVTRENRVIAQLLVQPDVIARTKVEHTFRSIAPPMAYKMRYALLNAL